MTTNHLVQSATSGTVQPTRQEIVGYSDRPGVTRRRGENPLTCPPPLLCPAAEIPIMGALINLVHFKGKLTGECRQWTPRSETSDP